MKKVEKSSSAGTENDSSTNAQDSQVCQPIAKPNVSSRLSSADQEELEKCKNSPVYFYNKYVRKEGQKELTEQEYNDFVKQVEYQRNVPLKLRNHYKDRPLTQNECFNEDGSANGC